MKKRMKQLMAVMLSVALCVPAIPGAYGYAATSGTTFTHRKRKLPFPDLVPKEVPF
ncbi:MAG: hypothetical protein ACLTTO_15730 [Lachnospiraceae bacterium]